jgi:HlyD family secretion protein
MAGLLLFPLIPMATLTLPPHLLPGRRPPAQNPPISQGDRQAPIRPRWGSRGATPTLLAAVACALGVAALMLAVRGRAAAARPRYRTETVTEGGVTGLLPLQGRVVPTAEVRVGPEHPGRVVSVAVSAGARVHKGDVLARLDSRQLRSAAAGAEASALAAKVGAGQAQMRLAQIIWTLQRQMRGQAADDDESRPLESLQAAALDAEARLASAAAELHQQRANRAATLASLAAAVLRAPLDGVVVSRAVEPGEMVQAGTTLFVVAADPARVQVIAPVGELDGSRIDRRQALFRVPAHPGQTFSAGQGRLEPTPASSGSPYCLRLEADNPGGALQPGMSATLMVKSASAPEALQVPVEALAYASAQTAGEQGPAVYVLGEEGGPRRIAVEVGVSDGRSAEIRTGALRAGTAVIVARR